MENFPKRIFKIDRIVNACVWAMEITYEIIELLRKINSNLYCNTLHFVYAPFKEIQYDNIFLGKFNTSKSSNSKFGTTNLFPTSNSTIIPTKI